MDLLMMILGKTWNIFMSIDFDIVYKGITYNISLWSILLFSTIISIGVVVLFKLFD